MKKIIKISIALIVVTTLICCGGKQRKPQVEYMPDMYKAVPYEANAAGGPFKSGMTNLFPVKGTIARGKEVPFEYPDTNEGYELAKKELKSPLKPTQENLENGKKMFAIYCAVCHGKKGDGNGILSQRDKFSGIPNYKDRELTQGSIYYVIMHGRNMMGSYASQLTMKERWEVVQYVEQLKNDLK